MAQLDTEDMVDIIQDDSETIEIPDRLPLLPVRDMKTLSETKSIRLERWP